MRAWIVSLAVAVMTPHAFAQVATPGDYGVLPAIAGVSLSADGQSALILTPDGDGLALEVARTAKGFEDRIALIPALPDITLIGVEWIDERYALVYEKRAAPIQLTPDSPDRVDMFRTSILDVQTGQRVPFMPARTMEGWDLTAPLMLGRVQPAPGKFRVQAPEFGLRDIAEGRAPDSVESERMAVFEIDVRSGKGRLIERGTRHTRAWVTDDKGHLRMRIEADPERNVIEYWLRDGESGPMRLFKSWPSLIDIDWSIDGFDPQKPDEAFATGDFGGDRVVIRRMNLRTGQIGPIVTEKPGVDVMGILVENWTQRPVGYLWVDDQPREAYFDPHWAQMYARALERFPGKSVAIPEESKDKAMAIVSVSAPDDPPSAWLMSDGGQRFEHLYDEYPHLENRRHGAVRKITYPARDGTAIPAYLTTPPGADDAKGLPLIVMPHGGPSARDEGVFDWFAQFLAARGYAVLQPNFRGSTGYGKAFERAGWRQWGGLMQDDVTDGLAHLVREGIADPNRVCIVGVSYGGYSALSGATKTPELYACVAAIAPVSDLPLMIQHDLNNAHADPLTSDWLEQTVASDITDAATLERISPARHAAQVRAPVLLVHGRDDTTVPFAQSQAMADALKRAGKPFELVELPGEDHYFTKAASRIAMLIALDAFLRKHLGPGVAVAQ